VDLLVEAGYSPVAMISMLEKLRAWERTDEPAQHMRLLAPNPGGRAIRAGRRRGRVIYKDLLDRVAVNHPKTEERIKRDCCVPRAGTMVVVPWQNREAGPWTALVGRPDVKQVMINYKLAFPRAQARPRDREGPGGVQRRQRKSGRRAPPRQDAYPNVVLSRAAECSGPSIRRRSARWWRAVTAKEPVAPGVPGSSSMSTKRSGNIKGGARLDGQGVPGSLRTTRNGARTRSGCSGRPGTCGRGCGGHARVLTEDSGLEESL